MRQSTIEAEVEAFIAKHEDRRDESGKRLVVRNRSVYEREILTVAGAILLKQGRVRGIAPDPEERVTFTSNVLPG